MRRRRQLGRLEFADDEVAATKKQYCCSVSISILMSMCTFAKWVDHATALAARGDEQHQLHGANSHSVRKLMIRREARCSDGGMTTDLRAATHGRWRRPLSLRLRRTSKPPSIGGIMGVDVFASWNVSNSAPSRVITQRVLAKQRAVICGT